MRNPRKNAQNKLLDQSIFEVKNRTRKARAIFLIIRTIEDKLKYLLSSSEFILYRLISLSVNEISVKNLIFPKNIRVSNRRLIKNQARNTQKASKGIIFLKNQQILKVNINFDKVKTISKWIMNLLPLIVCLRKPISISHPPLFDSSLAQRTEKNKVVL